MIVMIQMFVGVLRRTERGKSGEGVGVRLLAFSVSSAHLHRMISPSSPSSSLDSFKCNLKTFLFSQNYIPAIFFPVPCCVHLSQTSVCCPF